MESELHEAVRRRDPERVTRLLREGASPSEADWLGLTPLHCAATAGSHELAVLLLAAGADCDARDEDGVSAAHLAARGGHAAVLRLLLEHGADPAAQDAEGRTPLDFLRDAGVPALECEALLAGSAFSGDDDDDDGDDGSGAAVDDEARPSEAATVASLPSPSRSPVSTPRRSTPEGELSDGADASPRSRLSFRSAPATSSRRRLGSPAPSPTRSVPSPWRSSPSSRRGTSTDWDAEAEAFDEAAPSAVRPEAATVAWPAMVLHGEDALPRGLQRPRAPLRAVCLRASWAPPCVALLCKATATDVAALPLSTAPTLPPDASPARRRSLLRALSSLLRPRRRRGASTGPDGRAPTRHIDTAAEVADAAGVSRSVFGAAYVPRGWLDLSIEAIAVARDDETMELSLPGRVAMPPAPPALLAAAAASASAAPLPQARSAATAVQSGVDGGGGGSEELPASAQDAARAAALASRLVLVVSPCPAAELCDAFASAALRTAPEAADAYVALCALAAAEARATSAAGAAAALTLRRGEAARSLVARAAAAEAERCAAHASRDYAAAGVAKAARDAAQAELEAEAGVLRKTLSDAAEARAEAQGWASAFDAAAAAADLAACDAAAAAGATALAHAQREAYEHARVAQEQQAAHRAQALALRRMRALGAALGARAAASRDACAQEADTWRLELTAGNAAMALLLETLPL